MKIISTIEARMNSSRLPGKILLDIGKWKSIELQIKRLKQSQYIDEVVVATTDTAIDNELVTFLGNLDVQIFRGSEEDVLGRILGAAKSVDGDLMVQITGDCPLIDPGIVDYVIETYISSSDYDFVSNEIERTYPIGLDCRVFKVDLLDKVSAICTDPVHRVHGSTYIYAGPGKDIFNSHNISAPSDFNYPNWRWTLDTYEDLMFLRKIADHFDDKLLSISSKEIIEWLLKNKNVIYINSDVHQKELLDG